MPTATPCFHLLPLTPFHPRLAVRPQTEGQQRGAKKRALSIRPAKWPPSPPLASSLTKLPSDRLTQCQLQSLLRIYLKVRKLRMNYVNLFVLAITVLAALSCRHWRVQAADGEAPPPPEEQAATLEQRPAPSKEAKLERLRLALAADEEPIVINSVHTGHSAAKRQYRPHKPHRDQFAVHKQPLAVQEPRHGLHHPTAFAIDQNQSQNQNQRQQQQQASQSPPGQQPSQEFEGQSSARNQGQHSQAATRWPTRHRAPADSQPPSRHQLSSSAPPYAVEANQERHGQNRPQELANGGATSQTFSASSAPASHQPVASLIRDTSELQSAAGSQTGQQQQQQQQQQQRPLADSSSQQTLWMQSMRDNHNGPLRSRFNMSSSLGARGFPETASQFVVPVGGNTQLLDGHMKAKTVNQPLAAGLQLQAASHEQQVKSVREQPTSALDSGADFNLSRRNSKFTRQSSESTTPLSVSPLTGGQPAHWPQTTPTQTVTLASKTSELETTREPMAQTGGEEPATGNGHVVPLNETDLIVLGQRFELDSGQQELGQEQVERGRIKAEDGVIALADDQREIIQVIGNHHNKLSNVSQNYLTNKSHQVQVEDSAGKLAVGRQTSASASATATTTLPPSADGQQILMLNNNHKRSSGAIKTLPSRSSKAPSSSGAGKTGRKLFSNEDEGEQASERSGRQSRVEQARQAGQNGARSWSRLLPGLLQRTLASVLRRLTGTGQQQQQQQQYQQQVSLAQPSGHQQPLGQQAALLQYGPGSIAAPSHSLGFFASALSAAAAGQPSLAKQQANTEQVENQANGGQSGQESRQPLRQHANKKIIDSYIDLPASERRQAVERRDGSDSNSEASSEQTATEGANRTSSPSPTLDPETLQLKAEPREAPASESSSGLTKPSLSSLRRRRKSKTSAEWKTEPNGEQSWPEEAAGDYEEPASKATGESYMGAQTEEAQQSDGKAEPVAPMDGDELQLDFRTTTEQAASKPNESELELDYEESRQEAGTVSEENVVENRLYNIAHELGEMSQSNNWFEEPEQPAEAGAQDLSAEATEADTPAAPIFLYAPDSSLLTRASLRDLDSAGQSQTRSRNSQRPSRRKPAMPLESSAYRESMSHDLGEPAPNSEGRPSSPVRRRKPSPRPMSHRRKPAGASRPQVPPISLQNTKPYLSHNRPAQTSAPKPLSVFEPPQLEGSEGPSNMMSPMSSSINVMDLDPSLTRLAHNKLIVAKFKPKRNKLKGELPRESAQKPPTPTTTTTTTRRPTQSAQRIAIAATRAPIETNRFKRPRDPALASLTPAILGTQAISDNHLNDIMNRWTRPPTQTTSTTSKPADLQVHQSAARSQDELLTSNSSRSIPSSINGLRIMSDLQSLMPFASGLAARFSFPNRASSSSAAQTISMTNPTQAPQRADSEPSQASAQAQAQQQQEAQVEQPVASPIAPSQSAFSGNKNDKFNFSLIQMNNRERINPLLFPLDHLRQPGQSGNSSLAKKQGNTRSRLTTSTTTTARPSKPSAGGVTTSTRQPLRRNSTELVQSSSSAPPKARPSSSSSGSSTRAPHLRQPAESTTNLYPAAQTQASDHLEEEVGQTLRSQHHTKPIGSRIRPNPNPEMERLRNQYLAMVGKNSSLDGRVSSSPTRPTSWQGDLPGHISLVTGAMGAGDDEPAKWQSSSSSLAPPPVTSLEEAAHDANKYLTLAPQAPDSNSVAANLVDENEHSIVIISDNHHRMRKRPSSQAVTKPFISMHYSGQTASLEQSTTVPTLLPTSPLSYQNARKYLEEFVNGTRIRPSSIANKTAAELRSQTEAFQRQQLRSQQGNETADSPLIVVTNHSRSGSQGNKTELPMRRGTSSGANGSHGAPLAFDSSNGAPFSDSNGLMSKLDNRAQELLLDIFDRDPAYSASMFGPQVSAAGVRPAISSEANRTTTEGDPRGTHMDQRSTTEGYGTPTHYTFADQVAPSKISTTTTTTAATTAKHAPESEQADETTTNRMRLQSTTTTFPPMETKVNVADDYETTQSSADSYSKFTLDYEQQQRSTESARTTSELSSMNLVRAGDSGDTMDFNNRASMRKNQAKIQSILLALAKKNQTNSTAASTISEDNQDKNSELEQEPVPSYFRPSSTASTPVEYVTARTTDSNPGISDEADGEELSNNVEQASSEAQNTETTHYYTPLKATTIAAFQSSTTGSHRYPFVETVSSSRQKVNRPIAEQTGEGGSQHQHASDYLMASTPAMPQTTTKLTESLTNDADLKRIIKNRITAAALATSRAPVEVAADSGEPDQEEHLNSLDDRGSSSHILDDKREPSESSADEEESNLDLDGLAYPEPIAYPQSHRPARPIIIRRRPTKRPTKFDAHLPNKHVSVSNNFHSDDQMKHTVIGQKRRKKPVKRPPPPRIPEVVVSSSSSVFDEIPERQGSSNGTDQQEVLRDRPTRRKPTLVLRPAARPGQGLIRKRPPFIRLPPEAIHIHENHQNHRNKTITKRPNSSGINAPVSIILPIESIINRKTQDIRTRPLTIIDPATDSPMGEGLNDSVVNPQSLTRIPETTILHDKMVVTYKPGRPLPGSNSGFGSIGNPSNDYTHFQSESSRPNVTSFIPPPTSTISSTLTTLAQELSSNSSGNALVPRPQLGSGNGGDTLLVSIEQQQQAMHTTRKPYSPASAGPDTSTSQALEPPTTTQPPAATFPHVQIPHRPIIVISGLFDSNSNSNSNGTPVFSHDNKPSSNSQLHGNNQNHHHNHRPHRPNHQANSLLEAGSLSVVAQASHGQQTNSSRPWYPTSTSSSTSQGNRFNVTGQTVSAGSNITFVGLESEMTSASNQTADSIVGPDIPNFGTPASSISGFAPSGSYQNHHQQNQQQNQHIGMPFPGSLPNSGSRPNNQRPYRWRVKKRPNGNASSSSNYDFASAATVSNHVYRPWLGGNGMFSFNSLMIMYDNVSVFFARLRTFLISLMVMFLPPLALAASIVNAMSS